MSYSLAPIRGFGLGGSEQMMMAIEDYRWHARQPNAARLDFNPIVRYQQAKAVR